MMLDQVDTLEPSVIALPVRREGKHGNPHNDLIERRAKSMDEVYPETYRPAPRRPFGEGSLAASHLATA